MTLLLFTGASTNFTSAASLQDEAYAVGSAATILHYKAGTWTKLPALVDTSLTLNAVWVDRKAGGQVIYVAGDNGVMVSSCMRALQSDHLLVEQANRLLAASAALVFSDVRT
jgi:hypothetical protein